MIETGKVTLVGAGPGAVDLITVRGLRALRAADAVLYDALIHPSLLDEVRVDAELVSVGKRGYCVGSTRQETIHDAMIRLAREGKSVCRLKCGDPCVFGRGGEEAEALNEAGIPFEIVPGVTTACAAGFPLTHRSIGCSVLLASGHHDPESEDCPHDWDLLARLPVVIFYMAGRHLGAIARKLLEAGAEPTLGCAVVVSATMPEERSTIADLRDAIWMFDSESFDGPVLFAVGDVVRHRITSELVAEACG